MKNNKKWLITSLLLIISFCALGDVQGRNWLLSQKNVDGSFQSEFAIATDQQATVETVRTFNFQNYYNSSTILSAIGFYEITNSNSTEELVDLIWLQNKYTSVDQQLIDTLVNRINSDGGLGDQEGSQSIVLESALAFKVLADIDTVEPSVKINLLNYLLLNMENTGGYKLRPNVTDSVYVSIKVLESFNANISLVNVYRHKYDSLINFIVNNQISGSGWGENWLTALAINALEDAGAHYPLYWDALNTLRSNRIDGSHWNEDVFSTALAMKVVDRTTSYVEPSGLASITGKVIDSNSLSGLNLASVNLNGDDHLVHQHGNFIVDNLIPGSYALTITAPGYIEQVINVELVENQALALGNISIVPKPDIGVLHGQIIRADSQLPLNNALITLTGQETKAVNTDALGNYQLELTSGDYRVEVSADGFDSIVADFSIEDGQNLIFSPIIYRENNTPWLDFSHVSGKVVGTNNEVISGVVIIETAQSQQTISDESGYFELRDLNTGAISLQISATGFQTASVNFITTGGDIDIGTIQLPKQDTQLTSTLLGSVFDINSQTIIPSASVEILDTQLVSYTDSNGSFKIDDIPSTNYAVKVSANGYIDKEFEVSSQGHTTTQLNIGLLSSTNSSLLINEFLPEQFEISSEEALNLEIEVQNTSSGAVNSMMFISVYNSLGESVDRFSINQEIVDDTVVDQAVEVPRRGVIQLYSFWRHQQLDAGTYRLDLSLYDEQGVALLAQRAVDVELLPYQSISGQLKLSPQNVQANSGQSVEINAEYLNTGNQLIDAGTLTAEVYLEQLGKGGNENSIVITGVVDPLIDAATGGMVKDNQGNVYLAKVSDVLIITPNQNVSVFATGFSNAIDVSINSNNHIFVLDRNAQSVVEYDLNANLIETHALNLYPLKAIQSIDDKIFIGTDDGLFEYDLTSQQLKTITQFQMNYPAAVVVSDNQEVFILDRSNEGASIFKYANGRFSTYFTGLNNPSDMVMDIEGDLIVTDRSASEVVRIDSDKNKTIITDQIYLPDGIDIQANGHFIVTSYDDLLWDLSPSGQLTPLSNTAIGYPKHIIRDNLSGFYSFNGLSKQVYHFDSNHNATLFHSDTFEAVDLMLSQNGDMWVAELNALHRIDSKGFVETFTNGIVDVIAITEDVQTGNILFATGHAVNQLNPVTSDVNEWASAFLYSDIQALSSSTNGIKAISTKGQILNLNDDLSFDAFGQAGLNVKEIYEINGVTYVAYSDKTIHVIDSQSNQTLFATLNNIPEEMVVTDSGNIYYSNNTTSLYQVVNGIESELAVLPFALRSELEWDGVDTLWAANYSGAGKIIKININDGLFQDYSIPNTLTNYRYPDAIHINGVNDLIIGVYKGLVAFDGVNFSDESQIDAIEDGYVNLIQKNSQGDYWIYTSTKKLLLVSETGMLLKETGALTSFESNLTNDIKLVGPKLISAQRNGTFEFSYGQIPDKTSDINMAYLAVDGSNNLFGSTNHNNPVVSSYINNEWIENFSGDRKLSGFDISLDGSKVLNTLNYYKNLLTIRDLNGGFVKHYSAIMDPTRVIVDEITDEIFLTANSNNDIIKLNDNGLGELLFFTSNANYFTKSGEYIVITSGYDVVRYNLTTGEINYVEFDENHGYFQGIDQLPNGDFLLVSSTGLYTFDGSEFNKVAGGLNSIVDLDKSANETLLILNSTSNSDSSIYQLNEDNTVSLLHSGRELNQLSLGMTVVGDDIFMATQNKKEIIKISPDDNREQYKKIASINGIGKILHIGGDSFYVEDLNASYSKRLIVAKLFNNDSQAYQAGDLMYSMDMPHPELQVNNQMHSISFDSFVPPVAGNYRIDFKSQNSLVGKITSEALHVGVLAEGDFSNWNSSVFPGTKVLQTQLSVSGLETVSTLSVKPETKETILPSYTNGRFVIDGNGDMLAVNRFNYNIDRYDSSGEFIEVFFEEFNTFNLNLDNENYLHVKNRDTIAKLDRDGSVIHTLDISFIGSIHRYFDIDSNGNYWLSNGGNIMHINALTGEVIETLQVNNSNFIVFVGLNDDLYLASNSEIYHYNQLQKEMNLLVDDYAMEWEGFDFDYVCGNFVFAPTKLDELKELSLNGEEILIAKINPKIGILQVAYDSAFFGSVEDIDSFHFDKVNKRLLMNTHSALKAIDYSCDSLRVELHVEQTDNVTIIQSSQNPYQQLVTNDGNAEWVWVLNDVDEDIQNLIFDLQANNLSDGEIRPAFKSAYLLYSNPIDNTQDIRVDIDIPVINVASQKELNVTIDQPSYLATTDVLIDSQIINHSSVEFSGHVSQVIETESGEYVAHLSNVAVDNLASMGTETLQSQWNTGQFYSGNYKLVSRLVENGGAIQNTVITPFEIVTGLNGYEVSLQALMNKSEYKSVDSVEINSMVSNLASNDVLENMDLELLITEPDITVALQQSKPVNNLAPNASQQWQDFFQLNQSPLGEYTVTLNLKDEGGVVVSTYQTTFEVVLDEQILLSGEVTSDHVQIQPGIDNLCHFELTNESADAINALDVQLLVVNLSNQLTVQTETVQIDLVAAQTWQQDMIVPTSGLSSGDHACLVRTIINGDEVTQASTVFFVTGANTISGMVFDDFIGDGIINSNDSGIESVELKLLDENQNILETLQTEADGSYQFQSVFNGNYVIQVTETGVLQDAQMTSNNNNLPLEVINANITTDFGYRFSNSSIQGRIWDDLNADGMIDGNEAGYDNVSIRLLDEGLSEVATTTTDNGDYNFNQLFSGPYQLEITDTTDVLDGLRNTTENEPMNIDLLGRTTLDSVNFGYRADVFDLDVFTTNCTTGLKEGQQISYQVQVRNLGNTDIEQAAVENLVPIGLENVTWSCQATSGASCGQSGVGDVIDLINIPQGASVNYQINATVSGQLLDIITNEASVNMPAGINDDVVANNLASDSDMVLDLFFIDGFECAAPTPVDEVNKQLMDILISQSKHNTSNQLMSYIFQHMDSAK